MSSGAPPDAWQRLEGASGGSLRRLNVSGRRGFLLEPASPAPWKPWVFYAPTLDGVYPTERQAWIFGRALGLGIAVGGIDVGESFGSPQGREWFSAWHEHLTARLGLAKRCCLLPQSRGGLMLYNWAAEHPELVSGVSGIYTVCDLRSYPGLGKACAAYGLTEAELGSRLSLHNPVDRLEPLARHAVPLWHIHGDSDTLVPLEPNAGELARRYRALGGEAELLVVPGFGHLEHPIYFERPEVVESVRRQALAGAAT